VSSENEGYITIKIWDSKKGIKYKPEQARKDAVHALLYSGISGNGNCSSNTPILNKIEEQDNFKKIENNFFSKKGKWISFTRSSTIETTLPKSLSSNNWKVYEVSVSKNELRKYLEQENIIKSLNNGF